MKFHSLIFITILFVACANTPEKQSQESKKPSSWAKYFNPQWANNKHWYDGLAEVAIYDATRTIYNKERRFEYTYITVAEDFNKEFRVKTDDYTRKDLYKVMKLNSFCKIETENYPYHFLTSIFVPFATPWSLDKMTSGSQEWCGNTFKEYLTKANQIEMNYHSYWDGEGDGQKQLNSDIIFEDQLHYTLRSLIFKDGLTFKAQLLESQISSKVGKLKIYDADFSVSDGGENWKVVVQLDRDKKNVYEFAKAYPNVLMSQLTYDQRNLKLKKLSRYAYWKN